MLKWINIIFAVFSRLFVVAGLIVGFLARKRMGVLRSMVYRNQKLFNTVLSPIMLRIYVVGIVLIGVWIVYKIAGKHVYTIKQTYMLFIMGVVSIGTIYFLEGTSQVGLPLAVIGILLGFVELLIKLIRTD